MPFYFANSPEFSEVAFSPPVLRHLPVSPQQLAAEPRSLSYRLLQHAAPLRLIHEGSQEQILMHRRKADGRHPEGSGRGDLRWPVPVQAGTETSRQPEKRLSLKTAPALLDPLPICCPRFISYYKLMFHSLLLFN